MGSIRQISGWPRPACGRRRVDGKLKGTIVMPERPGRESRGPQPMYVPEMRSA